MLRSARIARGLTAQAVARLTKLPARTIAAIESGRLELLPPGLYARAYIRMYAAAVGISDPNLIQPIIETIPAVDIDLAAVVQCRQTSVRQPARPRTAAAVDAAIVALLSACGVVVCAALTPGAEWDLPAVVIAFLTLAVPTLTLYFGLLGATGVGTAGACLFRVDFVPGVVGPVDGTLLLRRTGQYFRSEVVALLGRRVGSFNASARVPSENVC